MDADTTFKLLAEAYKKVTERNDSYGDDGQAVQGVAILPKMPRPGKKGKVQEIALNIPEDKDYVIMLHPGKLLLNSFQIQGLLQAVGADKIMEELPKESMKLKPGLTMCLETLSTIATSIRKYTDNSNIVTVKANEKGDGYKLFIKEDLILHLFLTPTRHSV